MDSGNNGDQVEPTKDAKPGKDKDKKAKDSGDNDEDDKETAASKSNLFKSVQSKIGMDVTNFTLPVFLCEPTSTLQRMSEMVNFAQILNQAADLESPLERLAYVSVFYLTGFNGTERFSKPFNPVLGETFEYIDPETGVRTVCEQVSHHPPVSACHSENDKFILTQQSTPKSIFLGNSIELDTRSHITVHLPRTGDRFTVTKYATTRAHNLLIGFAWIDHYGPLHITNMATGDTATLHIEKCGFLDKGRHVLSGQFRDAAGNVHLELSGKWTKTVSIKYVTAGHSQPPGTVVALWSRPKVNAIGKHKLTPYVIKLNECPPELERLLPPTDSRLRPDRRALGNGQTRLAGDFKSMLENRQRSDRQEREKGTLAPYVPRWFELVQSPDDASVTYWRYTGGYWEERQKKEEALKDPTDALAQQLASTLLIGSNVAGTACDFRACVRT
eukprot:TRINITY_DN4559_c0_g1_i1.p1 TRINITY_DN4559_c0_g1~~TRINITY_DN4559_c0_g1_i1.p1  ORF type:complete len:475 (-),score=169.02 TRINITY_DN4559_c0_g1_i1:146-1477(-)